MSRETNSIPIHQIGQNSAIAKLLSTQTWLMFNVRNVNIGIIMSVLKIGNLLKQICLYVINVERKNDLYFSAVYPLNLTVHL
jgi:hypothetical protein